MRKRTHDLALRSSRWFDHKFLLTIEQLKSKLERSLKSKLRHQPPGHPSLEKLPQAGVPSSVPVSHTTGRRHIPPAVVPSHWEVSSSTQGSHSSSGCPILSKGANEFARVDSRNPSINGMALWCPRVESRPRLRLRPRPRPRSWDQGQDQNQDRGQNQDIDDYGAQYQVHDKYHDKTKLNQHLSVPFLTIDWNCLLNFYYYWQIALSVAICLVTINSYTSPGLSPNPSNKSIIWSIT